MIFVQEYLNNFIFRYLKPLAIKGLVSTATHLMSLTYFY